MNISVAENSAISGFSNGLDTEEPMSHHPASELKGEGARKMSQSSSKLATSKRLNKRIAGSKSTPALRSLSPSRHSSGRPVSPQQIQEQQNIRAALRSAGNSRGALVSRGGLIDVHTGDALIPNARPKSSRMTQELSAQEADISSHLLTLESIQRNRTEAELILEKYVIKMFNRILERKAMHATTLTRSKYVPLL